jgi:hypothetical protein
LGDQCDHVIVTVGDLESDAKGSGARKNAGKPQLDLVPVCFWRSHWGTRLKGHAHLSHVLYCVDLWQQGCDGYLEQVWKDVDPHDMAGMVRVLEFGAKKYKAWNWAKGMPWSVPTGCILRHAQKIVIDGEMVDEESGESHFAHILCNVMMLQYYLDAYPDGDDRPPV